MARSLNLAGVFEWKVWSKEGMWPPNVPYNPNATYKDAGWQGWRHWLGSGNQSTLANDEECLPFGEALRVTRQLPPGRRPKRVEGDCGAGPSGGPANVPTCANKVYLHGSWMGWVHWLYHTNLSPVLDAARPACKRAAPSGTGAAASGNGRSKLLPKRRRRCSCAGTTSGHVPFAANASIAGRALVATQPRRPAHACWCCTRLLQMVLLAVANSDTGTPPPRYHQHPRPFVRCCYPPLPPPSHIDRKPTWRASKRWHG